MNLPFQIQNTLALRLDIDATTAKTFPLAIAPTWNEWFAYHSACPSLHRRNDRMATDDIRHNSSRHTNIHTSSTSMVIIIIVDVLTYYELRINACCLTWKHIYIQIYTPTPIHLHKRGTQTLLFSLHHCIALFKKGGLVLITSLPDQTSDAVTILVQQLGRNKSSCCSPDYVAKTIEPDTNVFAKTTSPYNKNPHTVSVDNGQRSDIRESGEERLRSNKQSLPHRSLSRDGQRKS